MQLQLRKQTKRKSALTPSDPVPSHLPGLAGGKGVIIGRKRMFPLVSGVNKDHKWEWWQREVEHELPIAHEFRWMRRSGKIETGGVWRSASDTWTGKLRRIMLIRRRGEGAGRGSYMSVDPSSSALLRFHSE